MLELVKESKSRDKAKKVHFELKRKLDNRSLDAISPEQQYATNSSPKSTDIENKITP